MSKEFSDTCVLYVIQDDIFPSLTGLTFMSGSRVLRILRVLRALRSLRRYVLASFPGLHTQFCRLQYEKRGEGLEGFIT